MCRAVHLLTFQRVAVVVLCPHTGSTTHKFDRVEAKDTLLAVNKEIGYEFACSIERELSTIV